MGQEPLAELAATVAASEREFGGDHPRTSDARMRLGLGYREAGRDEDARVEMERVVSDRGRVLGPDHPDTLAARHELGLTYVDLSIRNGGAGLAVAIETLEDVADRRARALGPSHPDTLATWTSLAHLYGQALRHDDASAVWQRVVAGWEQAVADHERLLGPTHPGTLRTKVRLVSAYLEGGYDIAGAIDLGERIIDEVCTVLGAQHDDLRSLRRALVLAYAMTARTDDAMAVVARYPLPDDYSG